MARSKKRPLGTMEQLRNRLDLLRGQQLALEAASAKCPVERARKHAASQSALMQSLKRNGDLAEGGDLIAQISVSIPSGWTLEEVAEGDYVVRSDDGRGPGQLGPDIHIDVRYVALGNKRKRAIGQEKERD